jgi:hypothetical protein
MPNILHRLSIDAPPEHVQQLAAPREGIQRWRDQPSGLTASGAGDG